MVHRKVVQLINTRPLRMNTFQYHDKVKSAVMLVIASYLVLSNLICVKAQTRDPRFFSRPGVNDYNWPNPGDPDYRTYIFNDRRYGHYLPNGYGTNYPGRNSPGQYPQGMPNEDRFRFDPNNPNAAHTPFPGILAGWREDLQGKQRRDSLTLDRDVFVTTNYGQVQGFKVYMYDNPDPKSFYRPYHSTVDRVMGECSVFLGIPYALPPTFEGRFKPPRLHRGWQLLQAVDYGPACPQPVRYTGATKGIMDMDEDCLYLNIFSPKTGAGVAQKYPVMVYIHGGEFIRGASNLFQGHILASFYDVVVVTINYRLGALGFLSTGDDNSPGNYGILDQVMALKWIYDNVEFFNGDRESITLFGPGAGAASAGLLMVAPQTKNIVKRVIAQSGAAMADWALIQDKYRAQNTSRVLGQLLGCSIESSWKLVNCLRTGRSFYELGNAEFPPQVGTFPWGPVLDHNFTVPGDDWYEGWREKDWRFLTQTPEYLIRQGHFNRGLQYMTGVTTQEASFFVAQNESLAPYYEIDHTFFDAKIREHVFRYNYTLNPNGVYEAIKYMYTYWPDPNNSSVIRDQYINLLSDLYYRAPVDKMVKLLLEQRIPVYMYVLNTTVEALNYPQWRKYPHNIEHYFLTGAPFMDIEFFPKKEHLQRNMWTDNDRNMSHFFMQTYSNFARYGNPTPQQVLGLHFQRAYQGELRYLNINTTFNSSILLNYRQTECAFWTQYLPTVIGVLVPTYPPTTEFWWEPKEPLQIAFWTMSVACFFLIVLVVICCIMWRNAKRRSDFYDDDVFINPDGAELPDEVHTGVDNTHMVANPHAMRSRDNIYEYRDSPSSKTLASKIHTDTTSIRSPSSLAMTQKSGSQSSLKSTMSLKETTGGTLTSCSSSARPSRTNGLHNGSAATIQTPKVFEEKRLITRELTKPEPISSTPLVTTSTAKISITSEPISLKPTSNIIATSTSPNLTGTVSSRSTTPVPSARTHTHTTTATVTSAPQVQRPVLPTSSAQAQSRAQARTQVIEGVPQTSV
ncbi:neuroligin-2 isoform X1 [Ceratitis capitata]|uniref:Neuroligin-4, Y-linked n=1 Tax=Ceratitis capitata TaxID=7213 RepID=W8BV22_CERCA|nr:neuroligin-2 isoform X1 [Ceratitis capitata]XP_004531689.1 neuroligin-2 isoform X1 [Ceratitis capitata]XP_004531690.1 neuroligin-2 isoform X1 [Ceratitis capitata]XP_012159857.1 neuroligin-2 isoform X1 [Ceratitis capitata]